MEIQQGYQNGVLVLHVSGQIDSNSGPALGDTLTAVIGEGNSYLVLDLSDVPYISSAGLRALSIGLKAVRAPDSGGDLCLASLTSTVAYAFRISGFNHVFCLYDTVDEAVAAMAASKEFDAEE